MLSRSVPDMCFHSDWKWLLDNHIPPSLTEKTVYKQDAAQMMTDIMTSVMDSGTGRSAKLADMPCAGKTGTTNDHKDGNGFWKIGRAHV